MFCRGGRFLDSSTSLGSFESDKLELRHKDFQTRVIEHNIRTIRSALHTLLFHMT